MDLFPTPAVDPARVIRRRYVLSLSLIGLLLSASLAALQINLARGTDDSRLINVSGRQRMLSQQIAKLALEIRDSPDLPGRIGPAKELYEALMIFQGTHEGLLSGSRTLGLRGRNSARVLELYAGMEPAYRELLDAASRLRVLASSALAPPEEIRGLARRILAREGEFRQVMDAVTWEYDHEAEARRAFISWLEYLLFGLTLLALLLVALFIFLPAERQLGSYFSEMRRALEILRERATYDSLTGLYNRGTGLLLLGHELERSRRTGQPLCLCFIDLDGLKAVNDSRGHEEGDRYLETFSELLRRAIRAEDTAFRYGGDEFVIVISGDRRAAQTIVSRILSLAQARGQGTHFGFSYGFALFEGETDAGAEELLARADAEMYRMKEEHRKLGGSPPRQ